MPSTPGIDLLRGRPTPAIGTTEAKLQQRKLDALKRGIHRVAKPEALPYGVHVIGVGGAGAAVVERLLCASPNSLLGVEGSRLSALAIDIDPASLAGIRSLAKRWPEARAHIETLDLSFTDLAGLHHSLLRYPEFLKLEYPMYRWDPKYEPWLPATMVRPSHGDSIPRALAKAVYGAAYYDAGRPLAQALKRFAQSVEATRGDAVVCVVFGMGGGTGSGMALDLSRHLSNVILGRRVLVTGIGIAPCSGDRPAHTGAGLYTTLNELDCLCDEAKNRGVVQSCGDLYKNPFTAGFLLVPQEPAWDVTHSLAATHVRVAEEIASLLTLRSGANLWEVLRLLNWVAAPSTQHSAARTPWGAQWLHLLGYADTAEHGIRLGPQTPQQLGIRPGYIPEFIEVRVGDQDETGSAALAMALEQSFSPEVAPNPVGGGRTGTVQYTLPRVAKSDLAWFFSARDAYEAAPEQERVLDHALLLEQGVVLCEPSTRLPGMAGAGLGASQHWVAVPLADVRGEYTGQAESA